jgi:3-hydroxyisobutyrate dehydrogenase-like beta-hydroxyacid dehydrogenase
MDVGFIGLGNMGSALCENLVKSGFEVYAFDAAGPDRAPKGSICVESAAEVARQAEVVVLSLPDGSVSAEVAHDVAAAQGRCRFVIDTSTVGLGAARDIAEQLAASGIGYVDAPVSGGPAGARARTLVVMFSASDEDAAAVETVLEGLSDHRRRVGDRPGLAQAMKLANNFLSATALAATSEAIAFGTAVGLDMGTMIEVLNGASGQSAATSDKFPNHVLTERYASGFSNLLMNKDVQLYLRAVEEAQGPSEIGEITASIWGRFSAEEPGVDFTRIYPFVEGG